MGNAGARVLVAASDRRARQAIAAYLRGDGFQVLEASNGHKALLVLRRGAVDIALIDPMLPEIDGLELVSRVRRESTVPIIMLTANRDEAARIAELDAGADDYAAGPLSMPEVAARVRAQMRRARGFGAEETVLRTGELVLDLDGRRCTASGLEVALTRREFDLLAALLRYPGRIHTREQLLELVWATDSIGPKTVDGHVASLRRKLGATISIATLRGLGYRLDPGSEPAVPQADGRNPVKPAPTPHT
jgi:DNA-binding response OmpR family regulator